MRKICFVFVMLIAVLSANSTFGQRKYLDIADEYYGQRKYREAVDYYKLALEEKVIVNKYYMLQQVAKTYNHLFDYENAATYYKELTTFKTENTSQNLYDYAQVLRNEGKYEEAKVIFAEYAAREDAKADADFLIAIADYGPNHKDDNEVAKIKKTNIETGSRSLGLSFTSSGLLVAAPQNDKYNERTIYYDLARVDKSSPDVFGEATELSKDLNGPYYEGTPFLYSGGTKLLFSSNSADLKKYKPKKMDELAISGDGRNILKIYSSELKDGEWTEPKELSFNGNAYNCVFPNISEDGYTLYFSSDMEGGYGGYDLWMVEKINDTTWSAPINLGESVNTFEDETYPFNKGSKLYFSSKGHPGFGGSDIYVSNISPDGYSSPMNVGLPLNSTKDDFSFILSEEGTNGYLSTNREGTHGYDLVYYFYDYRPFELISGIVKNDETGEAVEDVIVELYKKDGNDEWVKVDEMATADDGAWQFEIDPNETYKVNFIHPEFANEDQIISSIGDDDGGHRDQVINDLKELGMKPVSKYINGIVEDAQTGETLKDVQVILSEIDINGERKEVGKQITKEDGKWGFEVDPDKKYDVTFIHPVHGTKSFAVDNYDGTNYDKREAQIEKLKKVTFNDDNNNILSGIVLDKITEKPVEGVNVKLFENVDGEWMEVNSMITGNDGKWMFDIDPNKEYKVEFDKKGFDKQDFIIPPISDKDKRDDIIAMMNPLSMKASGSKDNVIRVDNIYFDFGRSHPQETSYPILDNIVDFMNDNPNVKVELSAHTDAVGKDSFNMDLSQRRAERCKDYLVKKGIKSSRIVPKGYGETKILNGCVKWNQCSEEENEVNRRVEIKVL